MIISTNPLTIKCENGACNKELVLETSSTGDMADEVLSNGWSWLRNDEAYDHVCSKECRAKVMKEAA